MLTTCSLSPSLQIWWTHWMFACLFVCAWKKKHWYDSKMVSPSSMIGSLNAYVQTKWVTVKENFKLSSSQTIRNKSPNGQNLNVYSFVVDKRSVLPNSRTTIHQSRLSVGELMTNHVIIFVRFPFVARRPRVGVVVAVVLNSSWFVQIMLIYIGMIADGPFLPFSHYWKIVLCVCFTFQTHILTSKNLVAPQMECFNKYLLIVKWLVHLMQVPCQTNQFEACGFSCNSNTNNKWPKVFFWWLFFCRYRVWVDDTTRN